MNHTAARALPATAAATLALAALAALTPPASAATTASPFQQNVTIDCNGSCTKTFPQLAANQALDIDRITCELSTEGVVSFVHLKLLPASLNFVYPLNLTWQRKFFDNNVYTLSADAKIRVPLGRQVAIDIVSGGHPSGICAMTGTKLTNS